MGDGFKSCDLICPVRSVWARLGQVKSGCIYNLPPLEINASCGSCPGLMGNGFKCCGEPACQVGSDHFMSGQVKQSLYHIGKIYS